MPTGNFVYQDGSDIQSDSSQEDDEHVRSDLRGADELDQAVDNYFKNIETPSGVSDLLIGGGARDRSEV